ncbi:MAG: DDE-type integrase/transposase/recombinase [Gemmataceae bacterium]|nr:DDE-type integrase/transposase/recombinase [Gemmataceae bacterium]
MARRRREAEARQLAVAFAQQARRDGTTLGEAARLLGVERRTLRSWLARKQEPQALGRPLRRAAPARRNEVIAALAVANGRLSLPWLSRHFPNVGRAELADLRRRFRRLCRVRNLCRSLRWKRAGAVWAIDYSESPCLVEGRYRWLLAVRDLASGCALWWQACEEATAATTVAALQALFARWGRPLVLKADNGGHFRGAAVAELLAREGVVVLHSPPYTPRYNGAIEAGIGSLKTRTHEEAARQGRPGEWTCEDIEAAREQANEFGMPQGEDGLAPGEAWRGRVPVSEEERRAFRAELEKALAERERAGYDGEIGGAQEAAERDKRRREAISAVLVARGYLEYRRRRIPAPIPQRTVT